MNIVIFSHDLPFPVNNGSRIDIYNRIKAFKELNHKVFLITWAIYGDNKKIESLQHMKEMAFKVVCFKRKEGFLNRIVDIMKKTIRLSQQSNVVTQCSLSKKKYIQIHQEISEFNPDLLFVESIYAAKLAIKFSQSLEVPVFVRSHNIEHLYIKNQLKISSSLKSKMKFFAMSSNLNKYERFILKKVDGFFDISISDLAYWKDQGLSNGYWMPPVFYPKPGSNIPINSKKYDIAYIGNLFSPNNIESVIWFLKNSLPAIIKRYPTVKILIAGSKPAPKLIEYCSNFNNMTIIPNPPDVRQLYSESTISINPILYGSGVNIKTIEMLHYSSYIVCTPKAIEGLPPEIRTLLHVSNRDEGFANSIINIMSEKNLRPFDNRNELLSYFTTEYFSKSLELMKNICKVNSNNHH